MTDTFEAEIAQAVGDGKNLLIVDGSGRMHFADSAAELVCKDLDGYAAIPDTDEGHDEALIRRYDHLIAMSEVAQQWMADEAAKRGLLKLEGADEYELTAIYSPRTTPFEGIPIGGGRKNYDWQANPPLVLCATDYVPYTNRTMPTGRIIWVDPSTELSYLRSLANLGLVEFYVLNEGKTKDNRVA